MEEIEKELEAKTIERDVVEIKEVEPEPESEPVEEPPKKVKKPRSQKQIEAFERAKKKRAEKLVDSIKVILLEAIDAGGTSLRNHIQPGGEIGYFIQSLQVYGRSGEPCLGCGSIIKELKQSGRTTFYCSLCQR